MRHLDFMDGIFQKHKNQLIVMNLTVVALIEKNTGRMLKYVINPTPAEAQEKSSQFDM